MTQEEKYSLEPEGSGELSDSDRLFNESQKLWHAYQDLPKTELIRKRADDLWNRIDAACVKIHSGEKVSAKDAEELISEAKKTVAIIEHKNY